MANARVTFLSVDTSGTPIVIHDYDGNILDNPMETQSDGTLKDVPYFDDGVSYKVIVEKSTGIPPVYVLGRISNEAELYQQPPELEFIVSAMGGNGSGVINAQIVYGINGVRAADKAQGSVVCIGYSSKDDGCPSRIFTWNESVNPPVDNGITIIRSSTDNSGFWKMEDLCDALDVRMGGILPSATKVDSSPALSNILNAVGNKTLYFPAGNYYFGTNSTVESVVMEAGAKFYPFNASNVKFTIGNLDNRGGKFCAVSNATNAARIIPCLTGVIKTSWLQGTLNDFISGGFPDNILEVVIDTYTESTTFKSLVGKVVHLVNGTVPNQLKVDSCIVINHSDKSIKAPLFKFSDKSFDGSTIKKGDETLFMFAQNEYDTFFFDFLKKIYADGGILVKGNAKVANNVIAKKYVEITDSEIRIYDTDDPTNNISLSRSNSRLNSTVIRILLTVNGSTVLNGSVDVSGQLRLGTNAKLVQADYLNVSSGYNLTTSLKDEPAGRRLVLYNGAVQSSASVQYWKVGVENEALSNRKPSTITLAANEAIELFSLGKKTFTRNDETSVTCTRWAVFKRV